MVTLLVKSEELRINWHDLVHKGGGRDSRVSYWDGIHYILYYLRVSVTVVRAEGVEGDPARHSSPHLYS